MRLTFEQLKAIWQKNHLIEEDDDSDTDEREMANDTKTLVVICLKSPMCHFTNSRQIDALIAGWHEELRNSKVRNGNATHA